MPEYRLRGAHRGQDGQIGEPLIDEVLTAKNPREAITMANGRDCSRDDDRVNALWLVDAQGSLLWSRRLADASRREASQVE